MLDKNIEMTNGLEDYVIQLNHKQRTRQLNICEFIKSYLVAHPNADLLESIDAERKEQVERIKRMEHPTEKELQYVKSFEEMMGSYE